MNVEFRNTKGLSFVVALMIAATMIVPSQARADFFLKHTGKVLVSGESTANVTVTATLKVAGISEHSPYTTKKFLSLYPAWVYSGATGYWSNSLTITVSASSSAANTIKILVNAHTKGGGSTLVSKETEPGVLSQTVTISSIPTDTYKLSFAVSTGLKSGYFSTGDEDFWYEITGDTSDIKAWLKAMQGGAANNPHLKHDNPFPVCSTLGLPHFEVSTGNLNLVIMDTEYASTGLGPALAMTRTWNGSAGDDGGTGMFGKGWGFAYAATVASTGGSGDSATLKYGDGQEQVLAPHDSVDNGDGTITTTFDYAPSGIGDLLQGVFTGDPETSWFLLTQNSTKDVWRFDHKAVSGGTHSYGLTSITDRNGNAVAFAYDGGGNLVTITDAAGRVTTFAYDGSNRCASMTAPTGDVAAYTYDGNGRLSRTEDFLGLESDFTYNSEGLVTAMDAAGKTSSFAYTQTDGIWQVTTVTDPLGGETTYAYDGDNDKVTMTTPRGDSWKYYTEEGKTVKVVNPNYVSVETTTYNAQGLPLTVTLADGAVFTMEYDDRGNQTKVTDPMGAVTSFTYDAGDNLLTRTDALGNVQTATYDANGNLLTLTTPLGLSTTYAYDGQGLPTTITHPDAAVTGLSYDSKGNPTSITDPEGNIWAYDYDAQGLNLTSKTTPNGNTISFAFDANRRITGVTFANGLSRTYGYDCCSLISETDTAGNIWSITRDALLNPVTSTDPLGRSVSRSYDADGNLIAVSSPMGHTMTLNYDDVGRVVAQTAPGGEKSTVVWNTRDKPSRATNPQGYSFDYAYDALGRLTTQADQLDRETTITYDLAGRVSGVTNARGQATALSYDADGRLINTTHQGATAATYTWSDAGYLAGFTDANGTTTYTRDNMGRVTNIAYPGGANLAATYDAEGNTTSLTYPESLTANYTYDSRGRPVNVSFDGQSVTLEYDNSGRISSIARSNGVTSTYAYDAVSQLTELTHAAGGGTIASIAYTWDEDGRVITESGEWPLDMAVTGDSAVAAYDVANAMTSWGGNNAESDADGNLTALADARGLAVEYDLLQRPISLTASGMNRSYAYDALGRRVLASRGGAATVMHHDAGGRLLFETNAGGELTAVNIYAGALLVARKQGSGQWLFPLLDKTFNVIALTNESGAAQAAFAYTPHGMKTVAGEAGNWPFTYVGGLGVEDEGDGIYFMRNRYYDAVTGRFLQRDPLGIVDGLNLYSYAGSNPVTMIDPSGAILPAVALGLTVYGVLDGIYTVGVLWKESRNAERVSFESFDQHSDAERRYSITKNAASKLFDQAATVKCPLQREKLMQKALELHARSNRFYRISHKTWEAYQTGWEDGNEMFEDAGYTAVDTVDNAGQSTLIGVLGPAAGLGPSTTAGVDIINTVRPR